MNRTEWGALALALAFVGCGERPAEDAPNPVPAPPAQANMNPLPDFRSYVVGELPEPAVPSRDPFHGIAPTPPAPAPRTSAPRVRTVSLQLQGIMQRNGRPVALFSTGSAGVGDAVAGWTVVSIDRNQVVLERGAERRTLRL